MILRELIRETILHTQLAESKSPIARAVSMGYAIGDVTHTDGPMEGFVIYDPSQLIQSVRYARAKEAIPYVIEESFEEGNPIVKSGVFVKKTNKSNSGAECLGSYYVKYSASWPGTGMGPAAYEAAMWYYDGLTSDRNLTSSSAANVWKNYSDRAKSGEIEALEFDNFEDPRTPPVEDDCKLQDRQWLNYKYKIKTEPSGLSSLEARHNEARAELSRMGFPIDQMPRLMGEQLLNIFDEAYAGQDK
jgi:hypothetical protein